MPPHFRPVRRTVFVLLALALLSLQPARHYSLVRAQTAPTHAITWDEHSLYLDGHRLLLYSGEFHYWRLPSQEEWLDRLEKVKAAGLNAISVYFDWQYHSNAPGSYDFSGVRDVNALLTMTDRLGIYVIARVGPYMNGEADAGGLPGWLLTQPLYPRAQTWNGVSATAAYSPLYSQYSKQWYDALLPILAKHQVTNGGSVILLSIENEYPQPQGSEQYMRDLYNDARGDGITVPIFHNDFWFDGYWKNVVDLYAYDSYPYGFQCCHEWWDLHFHGMDGWETYVRGTLGIRTPMFVSELQGGSFDPWGGKGYAAIAKTLGAGWLSAIDGTALSQGTTILNTYMFVGGTSWGYMSEPGVYTSYDYGAPIAESGALRPSYYAAHRLGMFLRSYGEQLAGANYQPNGVSASNKVVMARARVDPSSGQMFIFLRHGDGNTASTKLLLQLGGRYLTVPQRKHTFVTLASHDAEVLTANTAVGPLHLNYTTSAVLGDFSTAQGHYLVLYGARGTSGETDFTLPAGASITHNAGVSVTRAGSELRLNYRHTLLPRVIAITTRGGTVHVIVTTEAAAGKYWPTDSMLLAGPDLVTEGDSDAKIWMRSARQVTAYGAPAGESLTIDGRISAPPDAFEGAIDLGAVAGSGQLQFPALTTWKFSPESPEIQPSFDDSTWALANHTSTSNPNVPSTDTLLADDYGFHYGFVWYRGHFTGTGTESGITLEARQSYSVYLNGVYLGSADESLADPPHPYALPRVFAFPAGLVKAGADNVVAVLTESLGHDEGWLAGPVAQSPQGILSAQLNDSAATIAWRIQGDAGGEHPTDTTRGLLNASGLYGERNGWYLPDFSDTSWTNVTLPDDWKARGIAPAVGWYRTHFTLHLPADGSYPIGLRIPHASDKAVIWLNGWLLGRYWEQKGPQHVFYLPQGILNPNGDNVLAIAVWNRGHDGGLTAVPSLVQYQSLQSHDLAATSPSSMSSGDYFHTHGSEIVDSQGRPFRIAAVNWGGMQGPDFVPAGLDTQPLDAITATIARLGFNTIRLPFSNQLVEQNPVVTAHLRANPSLAGLHALDIMDRIVASAGNHGLRVILDDHRSSAGFDPQENGLWYTTGYSEASWIADWQSLARRYLGNAAVIGVDLRDEPHTGPPGPWSIHTYLTQGATWGPYKGREHKNTDWRLAAERGGDAVLSVNPHLLVFVEGIQQYPDPSQPGGLDSYWWGGILGPAAKYPVQLSVPNQLVYSPHEYGPMKYQMPFFGPHMSYASMSAVWTKHWDYLENETAALRAPIFIGEFGTCGTSKRCVADTTPGSQGLWFQFWMRYLRSHPEIGWAFWALNGTNSYGESQPNYLLKPSWRSVRLPSLIDTLRDVEIAPPPA